MESDIEFKGDIFKLLFISCHSFCYHVCNFQKYAFNTFKLLELSLLIANLSKGSC